MNAAATPLLHFDHFGLVVADIPAGRDFLSRTLGVTHWTGLTEDPVLGVSVQFGTAHPNGASHGPAYELIAPLGDHSPIAAALSSGRNILNHVAYITADLKASANHFRAEGCYPTADPRPAAAYNGRHVQFFVSPLRFIIELIEAPAHRHAFGEAAGQ